MTTPIMTSSEAVLIKAGANVDTATMSGANVVQFINEAEALVNATTTYNWSDAYGGLDTDIKYILDLAVSAKAAMPVINYDTSGLTKAETSLRMNVLQNDFDMAIKELKAKDTQTWVNKV